MQEMMVLVHQGGRRYSHVPQSSGTGVFQVPMADQSGGFFVRAAQLGLPLRCESGSQGPRLLLTSRRASWCAWDGENSSMPGTHHKMPFSRKKCLQYGGAGHNGYNVSSIPPRCMRLAHFCNNLHSQFSLPFDLWVSSRWRTWFLTVHW